MNYEKMWNTLKEQMIKDGNANMLIKINQIELQEYEQYDTCPRTKSRPSGHTNYPSTFPSSFGR
jgi:hypothetical protein